MDITKGDQVFEVEDLTIKVNGDESGVQIEVDGALLFTCRLNEHYGYSGSLALYSQPVKVIDFHGNGEGIEVHQIKELKTP